MATFTLRLLALFASILILPACGSGGGDTITQQIFVGGIPSGSIVALTSTTGTFTIVDPTNPKDIKSIIVIQGLPAGVTLRTIAYRPLVKGLYAFGSDGATYEIDLEHGAAAKSGNGAIIFSGTPTTFAMSFDPTTDKWRYVDNALNNATFDTLTLFPVSNTKLSSDVTRIAYTNNTVGATSTTLYGITNLNLVMIGGLNGTPSPDGGVVTVIGPHGSIPGNGAQGLAIAPDGTAYMVYCNIALIAELFTLNLTTGATTSKGIFGNGSNVFSIAIVP